MSTLTAREKVLLEKLFGMGGGYVLDFYNRTFAEQVMESTGIDIYTERYERLGTSKANRLRVFWEVEPDPLVGKLLADLLEYWRFQHTSATANEDALAERCDDIVARLLGRRVGVNSNKQQFLAQDIPSVSLEGIVTDAALLAILESRLQEATICLQHGAPLAVIFLCGSILEGLLLDMASAMPRQFNESSCSPKDPNGKVKRLASWTLAELIDVACEVGCLTLVVKKFSHGLRDFRNFIHPREQMLYGFSPDEQTARICVQVLKAATVCLSKYNR